MNPGDPNDLNNYRIQDLTSDELEAMKPFVGALRTHAALLTEEADAKLPKGSVAYPLSAESVERDIRTKPELRNLWKALTPAQQTYAYNRYIQNMPARYETMGMGAANPYAPALEHDYHRLHNPLSYKFSRMVLRGLTRVVGGNSTGQQENFAKGLTGKSFVGTLTGLAYGGRDAVHMAREANRNIQTGGHQFGKTSLVKQPMTKGMTIGEEAMEYTLPAAVDTVTFGAALRGAAAVPKLAPIANSPFMKMVSNFRNPIGQGKLLFSPLFNATTTKGKVIDWGLRGLMGYGLADQAVDAAKGIHGAANQNTNTQVIAYDPYGPGPTLANAIAAQQRREQEAAQKAGAHAPATPATPATAPAQQVANQNTPAQPSERRASLRSLADAMFGGAAGGGWLGGALGGGLLGLIFGGKRRFLSGILGALLGAGGLAAYNYYKNKPR